MDMSHGASQLAATAPSPAQVAKAALRRLALDKLEPTPENYARAYAAEGGQALTACPSGAAAAAAPGDRAGRRRRQRRRAGARADGRALARADELLPSRQPRRWARPRTGPTCWSAWPMASNAAAASGPRRARRTACERVLAGSRSDAAAPAQRLRQLLAAWEAETDEPGVDTVAGGLDDTAAAAGRRRRRAKTRRTPCTSAPAGATGARWCRAWKAPCAPRCRRARRAPPSWPQRPAALSQRVAEDGATPELVRACRRAVPARAPHAGAPPPPGRRAGQAVRRADAGPDRTGRGRQLGPRPVRGAASAAGPKA